MCSKKPNLVKKLDLNFTMKPTSMPQKNPPPCWKPKWRRCSTSISFTIFSTNDLTPRWKQRLQVAPLIFYNCQKRTKIAISNRYTDSLMKKLSFWESRHLFLRCFFCCFQAFCPLNQVKRIPSFLVSHLDEIGIYHHLQNGSLFKNYDGWLPDFVGWGKTWCFFGCDG